MPKFRKKPVVIEAVRNDSSLSPAELHSFLGGTFDGFAVDGRTLLINTLEGDMRADEGDWIIKGVKGELYPCKPDIFEATYEPMIGKPELTEEQIQMMDDALEDYFNAHHDPDSRTQQTAKLLDLIIETRIELAQSLPCSECGKPRMGFHSDLCSEHYAQLARGELKVRFA